MQISEKKPTTNSCCKACLIEEKLAVANDLKKATLYPV
jgi:hypothetical protein